MNESDSATPAVEPIRSENAVAPFHSEHTVTPLHEVISDIARRLQEVEASDPRIKPIRDLIEEAAARAVELTVAVSPAVVDVATVPSEGVSA